MYYFQYISKSEIAPLKNQVIELIGLVQDEIRNYFTFQYEFIGSVKWNMVTCDVKSNIGFDFDVNIKLSDCTDEQQTQLVKLVNLRLGAYNSQLQDGLSKYIWKFGDKCVPLLILKKENEEVCEDVW